MKRVLFILLFFVSFSHAMFHVDSFISEEIDMENVLNFSKSYGMKQSLEKVKGLSREFKFDYAVFSDKRKEDRIVATKVSDGEYAGSSIFSKWKRIDWLTVESSFSGVGIGRALMLTSFFVLINDFYEKNDGCISWSPVAFDESGGLSQKDLEGFYESFGAKMRTTGFGAIEMYRDFPLKEIKD